MAAPVSVIAPYPELAETIRQTIQELQMSAGVSVGDLHDGLQSARRLTAAGTEVLVSRGGTALLLKRHLSIPVVEIEVTALDLLRCLHTLGPGFKGRVQVVGFGNVIRGAELLGDLLGLQIGCTTLAEGDNFPSALADLAHEQVDVVIGDAVTVRVARQFGLRGLLISSGKEAIQAALLEAQRLLRALRQERQRAGQLQAILDSSNDAIVAVNQENQITVFNRAAEQLFGMPATAALGRQSALLHRTPGIQGLLQGGEPVAGQVRRVGPVTVLVNQVPVREGSLVTGSVATLRSVSELENAEQKVRRELHAKGLTAKVHLEQFTAVAPVSRRTVDMARRFAATDSTLLILGESGTGKEMLAQGVHNASGRRAGPFVAINCAALPESLLESELFGYVEGAFTGASKGGRHGLFELAHQGTIFLDEIGEMPLQLQARLLRVLQEREVMRVGGDRVLPVNIRVVAATNRHLAEEVRAGRFREDLYYRLNVLTLQVPPLRERREDIPVLFQQFLERQAARRGTPQVVPPPELLALAQRYPWPGNVRELMNLAERIDLLAMDGHLDAAIVLELLQALSPGAAPPAPPAPDHPAASEGPGPQAPGVSLDGTLEEIVQRIMLSVLHEEGSNLSRAARRLGVDRTTMWRRLKRHGILPHPLQIATGHDVN